MVEGHAAPELGMSITKAGGMSRGTREGTINGALAEVWVEPMLLESPVTVKITE